MFEVFDPLGKEKPSSIDGWWRLNGERRWFLRCIPGQTREIGLKLGSFASTVNEDLGLLEVKFRNHVGTIPLDGIPSVNGIIVETGKWTNQDYDQMLLEIMQIAAGLPFSASEGARKSYERSAKDRRDPLYHAFVYLDFVTSERCASFERLDHALECVNKYPHRRLTRQERQVPPWRAQNVSSSQLLSMARGVEDSFPTEACRVAVRLGNRLPNRVRESTVVHTHDTPENRFVRSFLDDVSGILTRVREVFGGESAFDRSVRTRCRDITNRMDRVASHGLWRDVGKLTQFPANSMVLQRRRGYREIFTHYLRLQLVNQILFDDDQKADRIHMKDIARLYELWCFFRVCREVERILGRPRNCRFVDYNEKQLRVQRGLELRWGDGVSLLYNAPFRSSHHTRNSYSTTLIPDITFELRKGGKVERHLFDAKFKNISLDHLINGEEVGEEESNLLAGYKRADLYKMHAYRDAIVDTRTVWILYPGTQSELFTTEKGRIDLATDCCILGCEGVGAISLMPHRRSPLERVISQLII